MPLWCGAAVQPIQREEGTVKKYTHAWLAFKAIERLENADFSDTNKPYADGLIRWFKNHKDGVIQGAWYPDEVIKDMATSHVLKFTPAVQGEDSFRVLPSKSLLYHAGRNAALHNQPYLIDPDDNLPERCEALAHAVIDNLKTQESEDKGSPVAPTDNQVALVLFMLSHYVADAHMPLHCDSRRFSIGAELHGIMEQRWEDEVEEHFAVDRPNERFFYDPHGYPLSSNNPNYGTSLLAAAESELAGRDFVISWGTGNNNVREYMLAVCQYSYLVSYRFIPQNYDHTTVTAANWQGLSTEGLDFAALSTAALADAIDSIAKVWFRVWRRYMRWLD